MQVGQDISTSELPVENRILQDEEALQPAEVSVTNEYPPAKSPSANGQEKAPGSPTPSSRTPVNTSPDLSRWQLILIPTLATLASVLQGSSTIGTSLSLRRISQDLHIPTYEAQWLVTSATLGFSCTLLLFGRLADIWGHKFFFFTGLVLSSIFSLACGFAQTKNQLFIFRAMTGWTFACVIPSAIGILATCFKPGPAKSRAFATFSAGAPIGFAVGLTVAGLTTQYTATTWRTYFYIASGLGALLAILTVFTVPGSLIPRRRTPDASVDWLGAILATAGLTLFTFALADGQGVARGWRTPYIPIMLSIGILLIATFIAWEWYLEKMNRQPLMRLSIWRKGRFALLQLVAFTLFGAFLTTIFFNTLYWENYELRSTSATTVRFMPMFVVGVIMNILGAILVARVPAQILLIIGISATGLSSLLFAIMDASKIYWVYQFPAIFFLVWGGDLLFLCGILYASKIANHAEQAQAGSIISTITQLGGGFVLAIATIISNKTQITESARVGQPVTNLGSLSALQVPRVALLKGYKAGWWTCFAFSCFAGVLTIVGMRGIGYVGAKEAKVPTSLIKPLSNEPKTGQHS